MKTRELKRQYSHGLCFNSNDYLGLCSDSRFQNLVRQSIYDYEGVISGSSGSRLLSGNYELVTKLEKRLATFCDTSDALFFPTGYQANVALISGLIGPEDLVLSDQFNHASIIDGIKLSSAKKVIIPHNDLQAYEEALKEQQNYRHIYVICESVYSMQASLAPLIELARLCESYEARLIVDESHATGLFGKNLSGKVNELGLRPSVYCSVHTAGKALGSQGAWVAGDEALKKMLVNCSRGFIYSTAPAPQQCLTLASSLSYLEVKQDLAKSVKDKSNWLRSKLTEILKQDFELSGVPIIPIPVSSFRVDVDDLINELTQKNIIVSVIRYPTVAKGAECIRFVVRADQTDEELSILVKTLEQYL